MHDGLAKYPVTFMRKARVEETLRKRYVVRAQCDEERGAYRLAGGTVDMCGYFCERLPGAGERELRSE